MKPVIEAIIGAVLVVMVLNILVNQKNNTPAVANAIGANTNTIFGTLLKPGGS